MLRQDDPRAYLAPLALPDALAGAIALETDPKKIAQLLLPGIGYYRIIIPGATSDSYVVLWLYDAAEKPDPLKLVLPVAGSFLDPEKGELGIVSTPYLLERIGIVVQEPEQRLLAMRFYGKAVGNVAYVTRAMG